MSSLRPYQLEATQLLSQSFNNHQRVIYCSPPGSGKTHVFSHIVALAYNKGTQVLVVTHRVELFRQTFGKIADVTVSPQIIDADSKIFDSKAPVSVGMVETIKRRMKSGRIGNDYQPDLIIIDEAHFGNFNKIIDAFPNARIIGATASPVGKHFYKYYTKLVENVSIPELISMGNLLPYRGWQMQDDFSEVKITAGEFNESSLYTHFDKRVLYKGVVEKYKEKCLGMKAICFNVNIKHTEKMTAEFNAAGIRSECVTSATPEKERIRIHADFKTGRFPVLNSCGIHTTGYDEPSIEATLINRALLSLPLWIQMPGRASRPYPGMKQFICLDFGMNHDRHGMWTEVRDWSDCLKPPKKRKKKDIAPVKCCPKCDAMLHASVMVCTFCGYIYPEKVKEERNGVMVEIKSGLPQGIKGKKISQLNPEQLISVQKLKKISVPLAWRIMRSKGEDAIVEYARLMKYRNGWVRRQIEAMNDELLVDTETGEVIKKTEYSDFVL